MSWFSGDLPYFWQDSIVGLPGPSHIRLASRWGMSTRKCELEMGGGAGQGVQMTLRPPFFLVIQSSVQCQVSRKTFDEGNREFPGINSDGMVLLSPKRTGIAHKLNQEHDENNTFKKREQKSPPITIQTTTKYIHLWRRLEISLISYLNSINTRICPSRFFLHCLFLFIWNKTNRLNKSELEFRAIRLGLHHLHVNLNLLQDPVCNAAIHFLNLLLLLIHIPLSSSFLIPFHQVNWPFYTIPAPQKKQNPNSYTYW